MFYLHKINLYFSVGVNQCRLIQRPRIFAGVHFFIFEPKLINTLSRYTWPDRPTNRHTFVEVYYKD